MKKNRLEVVFFSFVDWIDTDFQGFHLQRNGLLP